MENEKIIEKIKKVLELSKNNPSQAEAESAALKAQKLMAEYHISMEQIELNDEDEEKITTEDLYVGTGNKWKYQLAHIVSANFRCKHYISSDKRYIFFYGYETDTKIASITFKYLFDTGIKSATKYYNKLKKRNIKRWGYFDGTNVKNAYYVGYMNGIKEVLEKQCTELMIVTPQEVTDAYKKFSDENLRVTRHSGLNTRSEHYGKAFEAGKTKGKDAINSRAIECDV